MTSSTAQPSAAVRHRPPATVIAATVLIGLRTALGSFGLVYFGLFVGPEVNPDAGSPAAIAFAAVGLVYAALPDLECEGSAVQ